MTKEIMIQCLNSDIDTLNGLLNRGIPTEDKIKNEIEIKTAIIETLKAESCEDAVSREAVMKLKSHKPEYGDMIYAFDVELLPPVTLKQRTGKWIPITNKNGTRIALRCAACGESPKHAIESDFCPNCGAKMESEV